MELSMRRWRPGQLLASWAAYWAGLAGVTLGPLMPAVWRATHLPDGHGSISAGFNNSLLTFTVIEDGVTTLARSVSFGSAMMWMIIPPLALWLVWLVVRQQPDADRRAISGDDRDRLGAGAGPASEWRVGRDDRVSVEREPVRTPNP
jgi:hypothetical protein